MDVGRVMDIAYFKSNETTIVKKGARRFRRAPLLLIFNFGSVFSGRFLSVVLVAQHDAKQTIHQTVAAAGAIHCHVRHDANIAFANDLHQLHNRVALRTDGLDTGAVGLRLSITRRTDRLGFAQCAEADGFRFTGRVLHAGVRLQLGDVHALLCADDLLLDVCPTMTQEPAVGFPL